MRSPAQEQAYESTELLVHTAADIGRAKAEMVLAERRLKRVKALAMRASGETSLGAQEREALASDQYLQAMSEEFDATVKHETLKAEREAAKARIDYWQTLSANQRGAERGYGSAR